MLWSRFFVISFIGVVHGVDQCEDSVSLLQTGSLPKNNTLIQASTTARVDCGHRRRATGKYGEPCNRKCGVTWADASSKEKDEFGNGQTPTQCQKTLTIQGRNDRNLKKGRISRCVSATTDRNSGEGKCDEVDEEADPSCFPSIAKVFCKHRGALQIESLRQGDVILSVDHAGRPFYDEVSFYSIASTQHKNVEFLTITTSGNEALRVTKNHHIPTGSQCCTNLKTAGELRIGDLIWSTRPKEGIATPVAVKAIEISVHDGLHSPVMVHGSYPIVDGIVTSFDDLEAVAMSERWMPFLSKICNTLGGCRTMAKLVKMFECHTKGECGIRTIIDANAAEKIVV